MSSQEPLWFCHECHAEMRPLMVPDPQCASCHGSFVEKMENPADDPREFQHDAPFTGEAGGDYPPNIENFLVGLQALLSGPPPSSPRSPGSRGIRLDVGGASSGSGRSPRRTWVFGGPNTLSPAPGGGLERRRSSEGSLQPVPMSDFLRREPSGDGTRPQAITAPMMAQYLMALMGGPRGEGGDPLAGLFGERPSGRMGDYVFGQEALDEIITQLMENSNASRPVPATDEIIDKLDRDVLVEGSPLLQRDCAVCKEQFALGSEDPDEQVVVTLPCTHPFHQSCILPWLKSSGTCPVCRHQLIAQPEHHAPRSPPASGAGGGSGTTPSPGVLGQLFSGIMGGGGGGAAPASGGSQQQRPQGPRDRTSESGGGHVPGAWDDTLD